MDDLARHNRDRWNALARAGTEYSRPFLELNEDGARRCVDREGALGEVDDTDVLGLAASGGQQSVAFALLGARVTILDLSDEQLAHDRQALDHHGLAARLEHGDMRDLSRFDPDSFDIVWQAHSLNFVPDIATVFDGVARVLRPDGRYRLEVTNPFVHGTWEESWNGETYGLAGPYLDGERVRQDPNWSFPDAAGVEQVIEGPREFRHTLGGITNGLIGRGFRLDGLFEDNHGDAAAAPGTWDHFKRWGAPWITMLWRLTGDHGGPRDAHAVDPTPHLPARRGGDGEP